jgi:uncharacterized membrane protein
MKICVGKEKESKEQESEEGIGDLNRILGWKWPVEKEEKNELDDTRKS